MKVAIVGSRSFKDYKRLKQEIDNFEWWNNDVTEIVSGGAIGADRLAEKYAKDNDLTLTIFYPDHKQYRHPYHHRNRLIAEYCDVLVAFWDGHSTGTKYTIGYARKIGKQIWVVKI